MLKSTLSLVLVCASFAAGMPKGNSKVRFRIKSTRNIQSRSPCVTNVKSLHCIVHVAGGEELEICEKRPKYTYNILDALIVDSVEFVYRSSCNLTAQDPFSPVFDCFSQVLDVPSLQLEWEYRKSLPPVIGLKTFLCALVPSYSWKFKKLSLYSLN